MKKLMFVLGTLVLGALLTAFAVSGPGPFDDVVKALKQGDTNGLSRYLDNNVEINVTGKSDSYSKAQAEIILKDFFGKNSVKTFEIIHKGEASNGSSQFGVGNMVTTSGTKYRTTFRLKKKGNTFVLTELRFDNK
ncbi:hypothetical protein COR50_06450 [Chitinophaga caeni]|uniref:DUF4783 domain-containing protein n=1 Tax=Chitinophaga caeni TaxID=2029983 RepID=A0A291QS75_9BACT|nr:DUF4783 domain-containing protein [Chitinophaga caeni]ATL46848.1 hypothetical protein COR50_06450 [Chitinophaga caeni]